MHGRYGGGYLRSQHSNIFGGCIDRAGKERSAPNQPTPTAADARPATRRKHQAAAPGGTRGSNTRGRPYLPERKIEGPYLPEIKIERPYLPERKIERPYLPERKIEGLKLFQFRHTYLKNPPYLPEEELLTCEV